MFKALLLRSTADHLNHNPLFATKNLPIIYLTRILPLECIMGAVSSLVYFLFRTRAGRLSWSRFMREKLSAFRGPSQRIRGPRLTRSSAHSWSGQRYVNRWKWFADTGYPDCVQQMHDALALHTSRLVWQPKEALLIPLSLPLTDYVFCRWLNAILYPACYTVSHQILLDMNFFALPRRQAAK